MNTHLCPPAPCHHHPHLWDAAGGSTQHFSPSPLLPFPCAVISAFEEGHGSVLSPGSPRALDPAQQHGRHPRALEVNGIPICELEEEVISFLSCLLNTAPQRGVISNVPHDMNPNRFSNDQLHHLLLCNLSLTTLKVKK